MPRFLRIALKDLKVWMRDPSALGVLMGMPVILILILGSAFGGLGDAGGSFGKVAIVNLDVGPATADQTDVGAEVVNLLAGNDDITALFEIVERGDAAEVRQQVEAGELVAALIVPKEFSVRINDAEPVELEVLRDPGSELSSGVWESIARSIAAELSRVSVVAQTAGTAAAEAGLAPEAVGAVVGAAVQAATADGAESPILVAATDLERDEREIGPLDYYSLSMTSMFLLFVSMFGAFSFITERREQTMARLLTTPTRRSAYVGGKMLGIMLLGLVQFGVLFAYTSGMMRVNWGESVLATWMMAGGELAAATGLAVLIASIAKTERGAGGVGPLVVQVMALLGGAFFQISILPEWIQPIRYVSVVGWALEGFQKIQIEGAGPAEVLGQFAALLAFAVVFFGIGVWKLRDSR